MELKIYRCNKCHNVITHLYKSPIDVICCGEKMKELVPNTVDAAVEKHVPVVTVKDNLVNIKIGSVIHPMTKEHYIDFIIIHTDKSAIVKKLTLDSSLDINYQLDPNEKLVNVYEYCNLHLLWKSL
ncbi:MAG: desulfoferrodoxin family protein [Anaeroplasmataceae bacterium]